MWMCFWLVIDISKAINSKLDVYFKQMGLVIFHWIFIFEHYHLKSWWDYKWILWSPQQKKKWIKVLVWENCYICICNWVLTYLLEASTFFNWRKWSSISHRIICTVKNHRLHFSHSWCAIPPHILYVSAEKAGDLFRITCCVSSDLDARNRG